MDGHKT